MTTDVEMTAPRRTSPRHGPSNALAIRVPRKFHCGRCYEHYNNPYNRSIRGAACCLMTYCFAVAAYAAYSDRQLAAKGVAMKEQFIVMTTFTSGIAILGLLNAALIACICCQSIRRGFRSEDETPLLEEV